MLKAFGAKICLRHSADPVSDILMTKAFETNNTMKRLVYSALKMLLLTAPSVIKPRKQMSEINAKVMNLFFNFNLLIPIANIKNTFKCCKLATHRDAKKGSKQLVIIIC